MKIKKGDLKKLLNGDISLYEAKLIGSLLTEEDMPTKPSDPEMFQNDSLDAQLDRFLMQAEDQHNVDVDDGQKTESVSRGLLREQGEDAPPPAIDPPTATPAPEQEPGPKMELDSLSFAERVARVVEHADQLLDIKGTVVRRALNWVTKNYDSKQAADVKEILDGNFDLRPDASEDAYGDIEAPRAGRAGPGMGQ